MTPVTFSRAAVQDRREITALTVDRFGVHQARRLRRHFEDAIDRIAAFPGSGRTQPELDPPGKAYRYLVVSRVFLLVYDATEDGIVVVRILHGARRLGVALMDE